MRDRATTSGRPTFEMLAEHFFETFPQLEGLRFTHRWGGAIDTCTRFCAFFGTRARRTGGLRARGTPGSASARPGSARRSCSTCWTASRHRAHQLRMVRAAPLPFPPEPLACAGIQLTRRSLARADAQPGGATCWLRTLDRLGLGFDS